MSLGVPRHLVNRETDGDLLALPEKKTFHVECLFPELPREHRRVVISHLPASGIKLATLKAIEVALERDEHICGRHPRRMILLVEANSFQYDQDGKPIKEPDWEPRLDPAITRLLRAWAKADLTIRQYRVLLALLHEGGMKPIAAPLHALSVATGLLPYNVSRTIGRLREKRMIAVDASGRPRKISLIPDSKLWQDTCRQRQGLNAETDNN